MQRTSHFLQRSAINCNSPKVKTLPIGLWGVLTIINLVFELNNFDSSSLSKTQSADDIGVVVFLYDNYTKM